MKTYINTNLIKEILNISTAQIAPTTLEKLRMARSRALDRQQTKSTIPVLAWIGHPGGRRESFHMSKSVNLVIAALFVVCLMTGAAFWQNYISEHEVTELDIAILTGDLPIHVYVD